MSKLRKYKRGIKNSMDKISNMNDELDLGVKIIDDSFEISGIENDYHGILNGVQDGDDRFSNRTNN